MQIVQPGDKDYPEARIISNARFDYEPRWIYFCEDEFDVARAIHDAKQLKVPVRVRSGGHHHEGMCSGNGVLIIDLSKINRIAIAIGGETAQIAPGAKLGDVYARMDAAHRVFPGGGCGDVHAGGLVQGGGWGLYSRARGLTCDSLESFRIVTAAGEALEVTRADNDPNWRLFWAVSGAGGGNYGVVTDFKFRLARNDGPVTQFTVTWDDKQYVRPVIDEWRKNFPFDKDIRITSFCRLGTGTSDPPAVIAGNFLGQPDELWPILERLLPTTYKHGKPTYQAAIGRLATSHPEYQPGPPVSAEATGGNLQSTCDGTPFPHKVSSCFPNDAFGDKAVDEIMRIVGETGALANARRYLSLHSLGGRVKDTAPTHSCFPFRAKPFMLQYQAWWTDPHDAKTSKDCLDWVANFRNSMRPYTEGSFINFPDRDLVPHPDSDPNKARLQLLEYYYAGNLSGVRGVKSIYDGGNFFDFEMGILPS